MPIPKPNYRCTPKVEVFQEPIETKESWLILFFVIAPYAALLSIDVMSFGLYYVEYCNYFNASKFHAGFIGAFKMFCSFSFGIITSVLIGRYGCRTTAVAGCSLVTLGTITSAFAPNIAVLVLSQGLVVGTGENMAYMSFSVFTQQHFTTNRAFGAGVAMLGFSIGQIACPVIVHLLIKHFSWHGALLLQASILAHMLPFALMFRTVRRTKCNTQDTRPMQNFGIKICKDILDLSLFKNKKFSIFCAAFFLHAFYNMSFLNHLPPKLESLNYTKEQATLALSTQSVCALTLRAVATFAANYKHTNRIVFWGTGELFGMASAVVVVLFHGFLAQCIGAALCGFFEGITNTIYAVVLVDIAGPHNLARSMGLSTILAGTAMIMSTPFLGFLYDVTHSYDIPYAVEAVICFIAAVLVFAVAILQGLQARTHPKEVVNQVTETSHI